MSMPTFPELPPTFALSPESSINQILSSIAMEELALSHIINAEGEKLQYVLGTLEGTPGPNPSIEELLNVNDSVRDMLNSVSMNQLYLFSKTSTVLDTYLKIIRENGGPSPANPPPEDSDDPTKPNDPDPAMLKALDGRILTAERAGDTSDWIELASYGKYSLILRKNYLQTYADTGKTEPDWNVFHYGVVAAYCNSNLQKKINTWFADSTAPNYLPENARLRDYTVKNDALKKIGNANNPADTDGFSIPTAERDRTGINVAFALSYSEAATFCSEQFGSHRFASGTAAVANANKLERYPGYAFWLRTPGLISGTHGSVYFGPALNKIWVFQSLLNQDHNFAYPALWVEAEIFTD